MKELTTYQTPPVLRFNAWRYVSLVTILVLIMALPFIGLTFWQLLNSDVNLADRYFMSDKQNGEELERLRAEVTALKNDTARLGRKVRVLERVPRELSVSNTGKKIRAIAPFDKDQREFRNYGAWATAAMRHYRDGLNKVYEDAGSAYRIR